MKTLPILLFIILSLNGCFTQNPASNNTSQLTGIIEKADDNHSPFVLLIQGEPNYIYLQGDILKNIKIGSRVQVTGSIKTDLYIRSSVPPPSGWHIYMNVSKYEYITEPFNGVKK